MTLKFHYLPVVLMQSFGPGLKGTEIQHPSETSQKKKKEMESLSKHKIVITALSRYNKTPTLKLPSYRFHDLYLLLDFRPLVNKER